MAHRGASRAEAENTVAAFRRAGEMGAQAVELDVGRTRDGVLVVHHNPHLADGRVIADTAHAAAKSSTDAARVKIVDSGVLRNAQ